MGEAAEPFRSIDRLLASEVGARSLERALRLGWIDRMEGGPAAVAHLPGAGELHPAGLALLVGQLTATGVVEGQGVLALTPAFRRVLEARELLEARLWFLLAIAPDIHQRFELLLKSPGAFVQAAEVFRIFDYSAALGTGPTELETTARWVRYTTALTRHEGPVLAPLLGLEGARRVLDVGGNSGEFGLCLAQRYPTLEVTVADLPAVCVLGERNIAGRPGAERVRFAPCDLRRERLPRPVDAIVFKSMLHDWPDDMAAVFLGKAAHALYPGGRLVIAERAPMVLDAELPFAMVANLAFLPFFRPAETYAKLLAEAGFALQGVAEAMLDMPFQVIMARKEG